MGNQLIFTRLPSLIGQDEIGWPAIAPSFDDLIGQTLRPMSRAWPAPDAIDRMEATFDWLKWLEPVDRKIVTMRASGEHWKNVCWKLGLSRPAAWQHWAATLWAIAMKLNGERVPKHRTQVRAAEMPRKTQEIRGTPLVNRQVVGAVLKSVLLLAFRV